MLILHLHGINLYHSTFDIHLNAVSTGTHQEDRLAPRYYESYDTSDWPSRADLDPGTGATETLSGEASLN